MQTFPRFNSFTTVLEPHCLNSDSTDSINNNQKLGYYDQRVSLQLMELQLNIHWGLYLQLHDWIKLQSMSRDPTMYSSVATALEIVQQNDVHAEKKCGKCHGNSCKNIEIAWWWYWRIDWSRSCCTYFHPCLWRTSWVLCWTVCMKLVVSSDRDSNSLRARKSPVIAATLLQVRECRTN